MKHFLFRHYYWIVSFLILFVISLKCYGIPDLDWKLAVTILGGILWAAYLIQKQKLDETHLFKELFAEFNKRYDELNEDLNQILQCGDNKKLEPQDINRLNDYFNLCGEEYFFYKQEFIPYEVWRAWCNGMKYFLDDKRIREYWLQEEKTNSYYGLTLSIVLKTVGNR